MLKIKSLKDKEFGRTIYIVANGPSVLNQDLSFINGGVVIGMNGSPLLEKSLGFVSDYYVVSDARFFSEKKKFECATKGLSDKTIRVFRKELEENDSPEYKNRTVYTKSLGRDGFSFDLNRGFYFGCTTTMLALQLAHYLGGKRIVLFGCDLTYPLSQPRAYREEKPSPIDNFTGVQIKNIRNAYLKLEERGVEFFNASPVSMLRPYLPDWSSQFVL
ncbi:hypothetical protein GCM10023116_23820 [Kistimonas scapharcae]|uniref:6-hydroxymethylpterin diphosphokinase MptE-like domain-containing protein n=1 Tax=Kistimonas scapharcae TaxID=1036133 RepID=A0ABP8V3Y0_9GAMM